MATAPLTPDFVDYELGQTIESVAVDAPFVVVRWADGVTHRFHSRFLAESSGDDVIDPTTRERFADPTTGVLDGPPASTTLDGDGHLIVGWPTRVVTVHRGWLRAQAEGAGRVGNAIPARRTWDVATLGGELPTFDGPAVLADDDALAAWLRSLVVHGVARLEGLPTDDGTVAGVAARIGVVRDTSFGRTWEVESKIEADSIAYTSYPLLPHTDLPTRECPPGYQLLHCRTNTCNGGASVMVDGFRVAEVIRDENPVAYANLTTTRWTYTNRSPQYDYRWSGRVIQLDDHGEPSDVRHLSTLRTFPEVPDDAITDAYAAVVAFTEATKRPSHALRSTFRPGDLVMFDNRRVLHGRDGFDAGAGHRHLQGCYVDTDDVHSRIRILARGGHHG